MSVPANLLIERILTLEIVRVTERAAVSAARLRGLGNEVAADRAAVDGMRRELAKLPIRGTVVIGEGERDEAPMLFIGEDVGTGIGPEMDIAVDPLEGTTLCAKNLPGAITVIALAESGTLLHAPDVYMEKIAVGPGCPNGMVDLDAPAAENIAAVARVLDRPETQGRAAKMGILDPRKKYQIEDMVRGDCLFAATGVTDGSMLKGVRFRNDLIETETLVMRSTTGALRRVKAEHRHHEKFKLV
jgi:fructose-1,6-bisphosphatase II / sedoheptulose-1,7-bisphosphatase